MSNNLQLESLKKDHTELQFYIRRLEKEGNEKKIQLFKEKSRFLVDAINRLEESVETTTI